MNKITHYCKDGRTKQLEGGWKPLAQEQRAMCETCGPVYANEEGLEHE